MPPNRHERRHPDQYPNPLSQAVMDGLTDSSAQANQIAAMMQAQGMGDPFAGLPIGPEACQWDAYIATEPEHEMPKIDEAGNVVLDGAGNIEMQTVPAAHFGILRMIQSNAMMKVWFDRASIARFKTFLDKMDDMLREKETGLKAETSKLIVPGR